MLIIILLGAPGSGKGTQGKMLGDELSLPHISTGDILRSLLSEKNELSVKVESVLSKGDLLDDSTMELILKKELVKDIYKKGFILDGYPRTLLQAQLLNEILLNELDGKVDIFAINFQVPTDIIIQRVLSRFHCSVCNASYNKLFNKPKYDNICDNCNAKDSFTMRKDDNIETVKNRISTYEKNTSSIISYYQDKNTLYNLDGSIDKNDILSKIKEIIV